MGKEIRGGRRGWVLTLQVGLAVLLGVAGSGSDWWWRPCIDGVVIIRSSSGSEDMVQVFGSDMRKGWLPMVVALRKSDE